MAHINLGSAQASGQQEDMTMAEITCAECGHTACDYDEQWYSTIIGHVCRECNGTHIPFDPNEEAEMARDRAKMIRDEQAIDDFEYSKL